MNQAIATFASLICSCQTEQRAPARAVGSFKLPPGQALTLTARAAGELHIAHGQVWVTFADAAQDASVRAGDHFLQAGELLQLAGGQQVVIESLQMHSDATAYFSWEPHAALQQAASPRRLQNARSNVYQPWLDLSAALHQAGWALGRLVQGVARNMACTLMPGRCTP